MPSLNRRPRRLRLALSLCTAALTLGACGSDAAKTQPDTDLSDAGNGGLPPEKQCLRLDELDVVMPASASATGGGIDRLAVDGSELYFSKLTDLYRATDKSAQLLYSADSSDLFGSVPFALTGDSIVAASSDRLVKLARSGGEAVNVVQFSETADGEPAIRLETLVFGPDKAYFASDSEANGGSRVFAADLAAGTPAELGSAGAISDRLVLSKDKLYWSEFSTDATSSNGSVLMAMSTAGGKASAVNVDLGLPVRLLFSAIAADADSVYLDVSIDITQDNSDSSAVAAAGVYRLPRAGGKATKLIDAAALQLFELTAARQVVPSAKGVFLRSTVYGVVNVYQVEPGASEASKLFCVELDGEQSQTVTDMAIANGKVYLAVAADQGASILARDF